MAAVWFELYIVQWFVPCHGYINLSHKRMSCVQMWWVINLISCMGASVVSLDTRIHAYRNLGFVIETIVQP